MNPYSSPQAALAPFSPVEGPVLPWGTGSKQPAHPREQSATAPHQLAPVPWLGTFLLEPTDSAPASCQARGGGMHPLPALIQRDWTVSLPAKLIARTSSPLPHLAFPERSPGPQICAATAIIDGSLSKLSLLPLPGLSEFPSWHSQSPGSFLEDC